MSACAALLLAAVLAGCGAGDGIDRRRPAGSALWADPRVAKVPPEATRTLRAAGVDELFVAAAGLEAANGTLALEPWSDELAGAAPPRTPVTLTVVGTWPPPVEIEPGRAASTLAPALTALRGTAEGADLLPVGIHLHWTPGPTERSPANAGSVGAEARLERLAELVRSLRSALADDLFLSVSLDRSWLDAPGVGTLARHADFVIPFLYGQPPGAPDSPDAWDPERTLEDLARVETLGSDYLLGLRTVGSASRLDASGAVVEATTRVSLRAVAENRDLRRAIGDAFGGVGRLAYVFQAQRRTRVDGWRMAPGEAIRIVRTSPGLLFDLRERCLEAASERMLGVLFHRLPDLREEGLTPGVEAIAAVLGESPPAPDLRPRVVISSRRRDTAVLEVGLENRSSLSTDLALGDGNYLSVRTEGAIVGEVDPGQFARYSLWREGREVRPGIGWREPDEVRLYTPMVGAGERIAGARVELRLRSGETAAFLSGRFYLTDGRELEVERVGGGLEDIAGPGTSAE